MNRVNANIFDTISTATTIYRASVKKALDAYTYGKEAATNTASDFKDETGKLKELMTPIRAKAKADIATAGKRLAKDYRQAAKQLSAEFGAHLAEPLSPDYSRKLAMFRDYGVTPSRTEINALLTLNGGNSIGLRALQSLLDQQQAPYRLSMRDLSEFEKDIEQLNHLAAVAENVPLFAVADLAIGTEIYKGDLMTRVRVDGSTYTDGSMVEFIDLNLYRADFDTTLSRLAAAKDSWVKDASCAIEDAVDRAETELEAAKAEAKGETYTAPEYTSSTEITETNSGEALAADLGREQAAQAASMRKIVDSYAR